MTTTGEVKCIVMRVLGAELSWVRLFIVNRFLGTKHCSSVVPDDCLHNKKTVGCTWISLSKSGVDPVRRYPSLGFDFELRVPVGGFDELRHLL